MSKKKRKNLMPSEASESLEMKAYLSTEETGNETSLSQFLTPFDGSGEPRKFDASDSSSGTVSDLSSVFI